MSVSVLMSPRCYDTCHKMADDAGRFEAEIDVDVSFNEFDVELCNFNERRGKNNEERITADDNRHDTKLISHRAANECEPRATKCTGATECAPNLQVMKEEDGEISSSSDDEGDEKMDCDEETAIDLNTVSHESKKSAEDSEKTDNFTFLSPNSVFKDFGKKECLEENFASGACKRDYETESAILSMESDNSMDDQSWKRQKRPKLEQVSQEVGEGNSTHRKGMEGSISFPAPMLPLSSCHSQTPHYPCPVLVTRAHVIIVQFRWTRVTSMASGNAILSRHKLQV